VIHSDLVARMEPLLKQFGRERSEIV
jgi:hypothetical protein